jgi:predicted lipoprotein
VFKNEQKGIKNDKMEQLLYLPDKVRIQLLQVNQKMAMLNQLGMNH